MIDAYKRGKAPLYVQYLYNFVTVSYKMIKYIQQNPLISALVCFLILVVLYLAYNAYKSKQAQRSVMRADAADADAATFRSFD